MTSNNLDLQAVAARMEALSLAAGWDIGCRVYAVVHPDDVTRLGMWDFPGNKDRGPLMVDNELPGHAIVHLFNLGDHEDLWGLRAPSWFEAFGCSVEGDIGGPTGPNERHEVMVTTAVSREGEADRLCARNVNDDVSEVLLTYGPEDLDAGALIRRAMQRPSEPENPTQTTGHLLGLLTLKGAVAALTEMLISPDEETAALLTNVGEAPQVRDQFFVFAVHQALLKSASNVIEGVSGSAPTYSPERVREAAAEVSKLPIASVLTSPAWPVLLTGEERSDLAWADVPLTWRRHAARTLDTWDGYLDTLRRLTTPSAALDAAELLAAWSWTPTPQ